MRQRVKFLSTLLMSVGLAACANNAEVNTSIQYHKVPDNWQNSESSLSTSESEIAVENGWLAQIESEQIQSLVSQALENNFSLKRQSLSVKIKEQQLIMSGAALWPTLDFSANASERKANPDSSSVTSGSLDLTLRYELDIWGKLSAADQQANLNYLAEKATFEQARQRLVADVVIAWFGVIEAKQLVELYQRRADNTQQNLDIIESGYRQGLSNALDVYLTRNEVNNELARTSQQQVVYSEAVRRLEVLVGQYPKGALEVLEKLPLLKSDIPQGLPSDLITRKPELRASWYQVLAQDSALAYAHKQRFPSISLTASVDNSTDELSDLLSLSSVGWSLLGNVSAPIFNAGKLKANEEQARLLLRQTEQSYLDTLYQALSDVENAVAEESSLKSRYQIMLTAEENAIAAQTLSFENYLSGLVDYTTVLDSQSRSFDAQATVIQIKNQLIANRVNLLIALGGDFSTPAIESSENDAE